MGSEITEKCLLYLIVKMRSDNIWMEEVLYFICETFRQTILFGGVPDTEETLDTALPLLEKNLQQQQPKLEKVVAVVYYALVLYSKMAFIYHSPI